MKPTPKTLVLIALASGMVVSAYLIRPAPAATTAPAAPLAMAAVTPSRPGVSIKTLQAPVPLLLGKHDQYFDVSSVPDTAATTVLGSSDSQQVTATAEDAAAKASIQMDGYRNVRALVRAPDGSWHGRAMRGGTEIAVSVDSTGNVSQD
jgi:hypothetical protein